jgi:hypothetical protein
VGVIVGVGVGVGVWVGLDVGVGVGWSHTNVSNLSHPVESINSIPTAGAISNCDGNVKVIGVVVITPI